MVLNRACSLHKLPSIRHSVLEECKSNYLSIVVQFMILDFAEILELDLLFFSLFDTLYYANFFAFVAETELFPDI